MKNKLEVRSQIAVSKILDFGFNFCNLTSDLYLGFNHGLASHNSRSFFS